MPGPLRDGGDRDACGEHLSRHEMAQIVQPDMRQARRATRLIRLQLAEAAGTPYRVTASTTRPVSDGDALTWAFGWALQASNLRPPPCKRKTNHSRLTHETATVVLLELFDTQSHRCDRCGTQFLGRLLGTVPNPVCLTIAVSGRRTATSPVGLRCEHSGGGLGSLSAPRGRRPPVPPCDRTRHSTLPRVAHVPSRSVRFPTSTK